MATSAVFNNLYPPNSFAASSDLWSLMNFSHSSFVPAKHCLPFKTTEQSLSVVLNFTASLTLCFGLYLAIILSTSARFLRGSWRIFISSGVNSASCDLVNLSAIEGCKFKLTPSLFKLSLTPHEAIIESISDSTLSLRAGFSNLAISSLM